jgi:hypothetical protein
MALVITNQFLQYSNFEDLSPLLARILLVGLSYNAIVKIGDAHVTVVTVVQKPRVLWIRMRHHNTTDIGACPQLGAFVSGSN